MYISGRGGAGGSIMKPEMFLFLLLVVTPLSPMGHLASGSQLPGKLGECPSPRRSPLQRCDNFCSTDSDCPGSERCCSTGCGRQCQLPAGEKRGFCPRPDPNLVTICPVECRSDRSCKGNEKCCSMGCHVRCVRLVPAKPGVCPRRKVLQTFAPCRNSCSDDSDCSGRLKCCFSGCGLSCLPPDTGDVSIAVPTNPATGTCQPFTYSGCGGNPNNFRMVKECQRVCRDPG